MNVVKIYENFIDDRNKHLDIIKSIDNKMKDTILDTMTDVFDHKDMKYIFDIPSSPNNRLFGSPTYYLRILNSSDEQLTTINTLSFSDIGKDLINDLYRLNGTLSNEYTIKYGLSVTGGGGYNQHSDFNFLISLIKKYIEEDYYFKFIEIFITR